MKVVRKILFFAFWPSSAALTAILFGYGWEYIEFGEFHPFLVEREEMRSHPLWTWVLYVHVSTAMMVLATVLPQFFRALFSALPGTNDQHPQIISAIF